MSKDLYFRQWRLDFDNKAFIEKTVLRDFKMTFKILHDSGGCVSYCDLSLYNLSDDTLGKISKKGTQISLAAGYRGSQVDVDALTIGTIFTGSVQNFIKERRGPDTIFRIFARGTPPIEIEPVVHETVGEGSNIIDIIKVLSDNLGVRVTLNEDDFKDDPRFQYQRGYTLNGGVLAILRKLAGVHNFSWTVQDDDLIVIKDNKPTSPEDSGTPIVSMESGMEGIPEITERGCTVNMRLRADFQIGKMFKIESEYKTMNFSQIYYQKINANTGSGSYLLNKIEHTGDTYGNAWNTKLTGIRP